MLPHDGQQIDDMDEIYNEHDRTHQTVDRDAYPHVSQGTHIIRHRVAVRSYYMNMERNTTTTTQNMLGRGIMREIRR